MSKITDPTPIPETLGDYRIVREIGRGGMGVVYEAEQSSLGRHVALKILPQLVLQNDAIKLRFQREARAAARLHHTNIVPVFGVGEADGISYYAMQYISGLPLSDVVKELKQQQLLKNQSTDDPAGVETEVQDALSAKQLARSLWEGSFSDTQSWNGDTPPQDARTRVETFVEVTPSESLEIIDEAPTNEGDPDDSQATNSSFDSVANIGRQAAAALAYAHQQGVLHRDIKPSNLLLDTSGTVWITDFGLAKAEDQEDLTRDGDVVGTLRYMPPEVLRGQWDARSDIFSLGLTLFELLALRPAYEQKAQGELIERIRNADVPPLRSIHPDVPRDLETIVHKAAAADPADRYQDAAEMTADLERFLRDEPIHARSISTVERCWRWSKRNHLSASLMAAVLLAITIGGITSSVFAVLTARANHDLARANIAEREAKETAEAESAKARQAEQDLRDEVLDSYVKLAGLSMQRGRWDEALVNLDKAIAGGHPDLVDLRLKKSDVLLNQSQSREALKELQDLKQSPDLGDRRGAVMLRLGILQLFYGKSVDEADEALQLVRDSLNEELDAADEAIALAMLAETPEQAVVHLERALESRPFDLLVHQMLVFHVNFARGTIEGRKVVDAVRRMYPDSLQMLVFDITLHITSGDTQRALEMLDNEAAALPAHVREGMREFAIVYDEFANEIFTWKTRPNALKTAMFFGKHFGRLMSAISVVAQSDSGSEYMARYMYLPAVRPVTANLSKLVTVLMTGRAADKADFFGEIAEASPTAMFLTLYADALLEVALAETDPEEQRRQLELTLEVVDRAVAAPPFADRAEWSLARLSRLQTIAALDALDRPMYVEGQPKAELADRAREDMPKVYAWLTSDDEVHLLVRPTKSDASLLQFVAVASRFGDNDLAQSAMAELQRRPNTLGVDLATSRAAASIRANSPVAALHHLETATDQNDPTVKQIRTLARAQIRAALASLDGAESSGSSDQQQLQAMATKAAQHLEAGEFEKARSLAEETLKRCRESLGLKHATTLSAMHTLALTAQQTGQLDEAILVLEQVAALSPAVLGSDHRNTSIVKNNLALAYQQNSQLKKAASLREPLLAKAVAEARENQPPEIVSNVLAGQATNLLVLEKFAQAEPVARECLEIRQREIPDKWPVFHAKCLIGAAVAGQAKQMLEKDPTNAEVNFVIAESLLLEGYNGLEERKDLLPDPSGDNFRQTIQRIIDMYTDWEKPEEVSSWKEKLVNLNDE